MGRVRLGRIGTRFYCLGLDGSEWVTVQDVECYAKFSELLVLLMFEFRCTCIMLSTEIKISLSLNFLCYFLLSVQIKLSVADANVIINMHKGL